MLEEIIPLVPVHFFAFQIPCSYAKGRKLKSGHLLPNLHSFHGTRSFAEVSMGWSDEGIYVQVVVKGSFDAPQFPNFQARDSVELFFDTRDVKTSGFNTRFCHHFYFLPQAVDQEGEPVQAGEATRFRTEDVHELCSPQLLEIATSEKGKETKLEIFIPKECLHGYDPTLFDRLGFTYRINRAGGSEQCFSANGEDFTIEQQPSLWASLKLVK